MGYGDEIMAAGHAQSVFDGARKVAICGSDGRLRFHELWLNNPIIATRDDLRTARGKLFSIQNGPGCRPYIKYPFTAERGLRTTNWKARDHVGRIYLTEKERSYGKMWGKTFPYVLIEPNVKKNANANKDWGLARYQQVVDSLPDVHFMQPIYSSATYSGVQLLHGENVKHCATPDFRSTCGLLSNAYAYFGAEGGLHHAAAVLDIKGVVIVGPFLDVNVTGYPIHVNVTADTEPCGKWLHCDHCREALDSITPDRVAAALQSVLACESLNA